MKTTVLFVLVFVLMGSKVMSQVMTPGLCPKLPPMKNFDIQRYEGVWYEVERFWFLPESASSCGSVVYFDKGDNKTFGVEISQNAFGQKFMNHGTTKFNKRDKSADLTLDLLMTQSPIPFMVHVRYLVLHTDYQNYSIKWTCIRVGSMNFQNLWILSRTRYLSRNTRSRVYEILRAYGLNPDNLVRAEQDQCNDDNYV